MKRILFITILIVGLTAGYGFAQMGQGMMGSDQGYMGGQSQQQTDGSGYYPCQQMMGSGMMGGMMRGMMGQGGGYGMMGPGMMRGMMGQGHMGGYGTMGGMMGQGRMGGYGMMGGMMGQGHMGGYGTMGGYGSREYDPEAYKKYQEEYQKYLDDTAGLRKKLYKKNFEYSEAVRNPNTTRKSLMKIEKEMMEIKWEIYEKAPGE